MTLVEKHVIRKGHKFFVEADRLCFLSKNLYNYANYLIRQDFIAGRGYISYPALQKLLQDSRQADYVALPAKVSQQTLKLLDKSWKSFFRAIASYANNPSLFSGRPRLPGYKDKISGRFPVIYTIQAVSKVALKDHAIALSKTGIRFFTKAENIQQVRIIPRQSHCVIEVVYEKDIIPTETKRDSFMSIDMGVDNLASCFLNLSGENFIVNGKPVKSINQFFNKRKAALQGGLNNPKQVTRRMQRLSLKRQNKIDDYFHKASALIVEKAKEAEVCEIIIGNNKGWKQSVNIGKVNNQKFVSIPYVKLIDKITYKAELNGIRVRIVEESYTSKIDHIVGEALEKQENYSGKRIERGLFLSASGHVLNSDINGAIGIMRKVVPAPVVFRKGIEGVVVHPIRLTL